MCTVIDTALPHAAHNIHSLSSNAYSYLPYLPYRIGTTFFFEKNNTSQHKKTTDMAVRPINTTPSHPTAKTIERDRGPLKALYHNVPQLLLKKATLTNATLISAQQRILINTVKNTMRLLLSFQLPPREPRRSYT